ncbi:MAG: BrnA antitoxin family protein [Ardenticatenaceae bacterium]|nr:BrnA antitoxin family protein [Ardenticatenaceae bacterium]
MKNEYDFSKGKRGALISNKGKTRITIYIDTAILEEFRTQAEEKGLGYQTLINQALREYLGEKDEVPVSEKLLRRILQEEMANYRVEKKE